MKNPIVRFFIIFAGLLFLLELYVRVSTLAKGGAESPMMFIICGFGSLIAAVLIPYIRSNLD